MTHHSRKLAWFAALAAGMLPMTQALAQYDGGNSQPPPLYPYVAQGNPPYAVEVAPNTYVIQRAAPTRAYPYVRCQNCGHSARNPAPKQGQPRFDRPPKPADRALIEKLRKRSSVKQVTVNTTKIVRHPPIVVETRRVVDDPPRIIERRHVVEDEPMRPRHRKQATVEERAPDRRAGRDDNKKRVIQADAEVTILGPDRMSIRLFRKGQGPKANVRVE